MVSLVVLVILAVLLVRVPALRQLVMGVLKGALLVLVFFGRHDPRATALGFDAMDRGRWTS